MFALKQDRWVVEGEVLEADWARREVVLAHVERLQPFHGTVFVGAVAEIRAACIS